LAEADLGHQRVDCLLQKRCWLEGARQARMRTHAASAAPEVVRGET